MAKANLKFAGPGWKKTHREPFNPDTDKHHYNCPKTKKW